MNNFFLAVSNRKKTKLNRAGIPYAEMEIDDINGIVLEQEHIVNCLGTIGVDVTSYNETSIPGIILLKTATAATVTFNPESVAPEPATEAEPPRETEITIINRGSARCDHWVKLLDSVKRWADDNLRNTPNIHRVNIYEAHASNPEVVFSENEFNIVLGRHLNFESATLVQGSVEIYPARRAICFNNMPKCPDNDDISNVLASIKDYLPAIFAPTAEEAETKLAELAAELAKKPYEVKFVSWNGHVSKTDFAELIREVLPKPLCNGVTVSVPHGEKERLAPKDGQLYIHIWSSPSSGRNVSTPGRMWNTSVSCSDDSFVPSESGITITESGGCPVAEVIDNNLYIFHDATHYGYSDDLVILRRILEETARIISLSDEEKAAIINAPKVILDKLVGRHADIKSLTESVLLPLLQRKIIVHNATDRSSGNSPIEDGAFHLWIFSSATGAPSGKIKMPEKLFGRTTNHNLGWSLFQPSITGIDLVDPDSLFAVGEMIGDNNLYVHLNVAHTSMENGAAVYEGILRLAAVEINRTPEEKLVRAAEMTAIRHQRNIRNFVQICLKRDKAVLDETNRALKEAGESTVAYRKKLVEMIRKEHELNYKLDMMQSRTKSSEADMEQEFNNLLQIEGVEGVVAHENMIAINTYHIYITTQKKDGQDITFDIGKFRIEIYLNGDHGGILFFNTTGKGTGGGYNIIHPHVSSNGQPCLGNIKEMIAELIAEYQFTAIASLAIQYLETVNTEDSAGREIFNCWPIVEK